MARRGLGLPPAAALHLRLAGLPPRPDAVAESAAATLARGLDEREWEVLRALARRDGVSGAVRRRLARLDVAPPAATAAALDREARVAEFHRRRLEARLAEVLGLLGAAGLRPVLLKGAALARVAYGGAAERPMADLDLLLPEDEAAAAVARLVAAGWRPERALPAAAYAAHQHLPALREPGAVPGAPAAIVEVHRALLADGHPYRLPAAGVRARARAIAGPGPDGTVLVPSPEDLLVHAAVHFAWAHELRWGGWRAIADVAALLAPADGGAPPDAGALVAHARATGTGAALYWTLRLAAAAGGVALPAPLRAALDGLRPGSRWAAAGLLRHLAHQQVPGAGTVPSVAVQRVLWRRAMGAAAGSPWRSGVGGVGSAVGAPPGDGPGAAARLGRQLRRLGAWAAWWRAVRRR